MTTDENKKNVAGRFDYHRALDHEDLKKFINGPQVERVISIYSQGSMQIAWVELKAEPAKAEPITKKNSPKEK